MTAKNGESDDQLQEILRSIPERFAIAKTGVDFSTQQAYLALAANIEHDLFSEQEVLTKSEALFNAATPVDEKKETLVMLAHTYTRCLSSSGAICGNGRAGTTGLDHLGTGRMSHAA